MDSNFNVSRRCYSQRHLRVFSFTHASEPNTRTDEWQDDLIDRAGGPRTTWRGHDVLRPVGAEPVVENTAVRRGKEKRVLQARHQDTSSSRNTKQRRYQHLTQTRGTQSLLGAMSNFHPPTQLPSTPSSSDHLSPILALLHPSGSRITALYSAVLRACTALVSIIQQSAMITPDPNKDNKPKILNQIPPKVFSQRGENRGLVTTGRLWLGGHVGNLERGWKMDSDCVRADFRRRRRVVVR